MKYVLKCVLTLANLILSWRLGIWLWTNVSGHFSAVSLLLLLAVPIVHGVVLLLLYGLLPKTGLCTVRGFHIFALVFPLILLIAFIVLAYVGDFSSSSMSVSNIRQFSTCGLVYFAVVTVLYLLLRRIFHRKKPQPAQKPQ